MAPFRIAALAALMVCAAGAAHAQMPMGPGMGFPGSGFPGAASPAQPQQPQQPPCFAEFVPLREEAQKRGLAIKAAADRKNKDRTEICNAFKRFAEAEAKVVKFVQTNKDACNIPAQALTDLRSNHARTLQMRDKICAAGPVGAEAPVRPSGPGLSEALGTQRLPLDSPSGSSGTFDTLSGNVIKR